MCTLSRNRAGTVVVCKKIWHNNAVKAVFKGSDHNVPYM